MGKNYKWFVVGMLWLICFFNYADRQAMSSVLPLLEKEMGLTPVQRSTGGKERLGGTSKRGERTIRRLLIIGASAVVRWAARKGAPAGSWLERMLTRKPRMLVAVALANKMARIVWALLAKGGIYRASIAAT